MGAFGGQEVQSSSSGSLSDDATHVAPDGPAFSIWSVIYLGLAAYVVHQWLPSRAAHPRERAVGYLVAASMVLNAAWILAAEGDLIWLTVAIILVLLLALCRIIVLLHRTPRSEERRVGKECRLREMSCTVLENRRQLM